ncbi:hypothetical protein [Billgrantia endophytica]|uniref:hypothetical protein n=1 Tax=Billgrantia endophytica TaxID=2033802 RepID=UPI001055541F|nr:hypothetical protein [Halomonas endophytica]
MKTRIGLAIGVLVFGGLAVAGYEEQTPEAYCNSNFSDTSLVMELRQESIDSKKNVVEIISSSHYGGDREIVRKIVEKAFNVPYSPDHTVKAREVSNFKDAGMKICLQHKNNK